MSFYHVCVKCHDGWKAVAVKIRDTLVRPKTFHSTALYSQFESWYFEWQMHNSYSYSDGFASWFPKRYPQIISAESPRCIWHYLNRWLFFFFALFAWILLQSTTTELLFQPVLQLTITAAAHYRRSCWCEVKPRLANCLQVGGKEAPRRATQKLHTIKLIIFYSVCKCALRIISREWKMMVGWQNNKPPRNTHVYSISLLLFRKLNFIHSWLWDLVCPPFAAVRAAHLLSSLLKYLLTSTSTRMFSDGFCNLWMDNGSVHISLKFTAQLLGELWWVGPSFPVISGYLRCL